MGIATKIPALMLAAAIGGGDLSDLYVFDNLAEAAAASPGDNVTNFWTAGRDVPGDGGAAHWVLKQTPTSSAVVTCKNGKKFELSVDIANVRIFGAMGRNEGDNVDGIKQAINYAKSRMPMPIPVYAPAGIYQVRSTIEADFSNFKIFGDGSDTIFRSVNLAGPIFRLNCGNGVLNFVQMHDFCFEGYHDTFGNPTTNGIQVVGGGNGAFVGMGQSQFYNIQPRGLNAFFVSDAPTHPTAFGNEGPVNWCRFHNIDFNPFGNQCRYGFVFNTGSGTGNKFSRLGGVIEYSVLLYQNGIGGGSTVVVGDIVCEDMEQWASSNTVDSTILTVGANTNYRSRITIRGGQLDAGFRRVLSLDTAGVGFTNIIVDVAMGGAATPGIYPQLGGQSFFNGGRGVVGANGG